MHELPAPLPTVEEFVARCLDDLVRRNLAHQRDWGMDRATRWQLDMDRRQLLFQLPGGGRVSAEPQIIGSLDTRRGTWLWAWDNPTVDAPLRRDAEALRQWGERWSVAALTQRSWPATEQDAWNMTALALHLFRASGAYRAPADGLLVFMTFDQVKKLDD